MVSLETIQKLVLYTGIIKFSWTLFVPVIFEPQLKLILSVALFQIIHELATLKLLMG